MGENDQMRSTMLVAVGGVVGASLRWGVGAGVPTEVGSFPWATLLVNVVGCLLIGFAAQRFTRGSDLWLALVVGGLGGLTTFSAFAVETRQLVDAERPLTALVYVAVTLVAGLGALEVARSRRSTHA
jgi:CrcB protein